jgi:hypothetical protein
MLSSLVTLAPAAPVVRTLAAAESSSQPGDTALLATAISATVSAGSFRLRATASGTLTPRDTFMGHSTIDLDGSLIEGDLDVDAGMGSFTFKLAVQRRPDVEGALVLPGDGNAYVRLSSFLGLADGEWHRIRDLALPDVGSEDGASSGSADPISVLRSPFALLLVLAGSGITVASVGQHACAAGSCDRLSVVVPLSAVEGLGDELVGEAPLVGEPIRMLVDVDQATRRIVRVEAWVSVATTGEVVSVNGAYTLELTDYGVAVSVEAPPPDQVTDEPVLGLF